MIDITPGNYVLMLVFFASLSLTFPIQRRHSRDYFRLKRRVDDYHHTMAKGDGVYFTGTKYFDNALQDQFDLDSAQQSRLLLMWLNTVWIVIHLGIAAVTVGNTVFSTLNLVAGVLVLIAAVDSWNAGRDEYTSKKK